MTFTKSENKLIKILKRRKGIPIPSTEITDRRYRHSPDERPQYAQQSVVTTLTALARKVAGSKEPYRIVRTDRAGPHPITFTYLEKTR